MYTPNPDLLQGTLYSPDREHDACGVGMVVDIKGRQSHRIVRQALTVLTNMKHRGALGAEPNTGDGAGILMQTPACVPPAGVRRVRLRRCLRRAITASGWSSCSPRCRAPRRM